jgi:hypothetical protein
VAIRAPFAGRRILFRRCCDMPGSDSHRTPPQGPPPDAPNPTPRHRWSIGDVIEVICMALDLLGFFFH